MLSTSNFQQRFNNNKLTTKNLKTFCDGNMSEPISKCDNTCKCRCLVPMRSTASGCSTCPCHKGECTHDNPCCKHAHGYKHFEQRPHLADDDDLEVIAAAKTAVAETTVDETAVSSYNSSSVFTSIDRAETTVAETTVDETAVSSYNLSSVFTSIDR